MLEDCLDVSMLFDQIQRSFLSDTFDRVAIITAEENAEICELEKQTETITDNEAELSHLDEIDAETFENLAQGIFTDRRLSRIQMKNNRRSLNNKPCFTEGQVTDKDIGTERQRLKKRTIRNRDLRVRISLTSISSVPTP
jgi:hypothetical protein